MMPASDSTLFKHAREASTVRVDQVPRGGGREIVDYFRDHIGPIKNVDLFGNSMEITFSNPDAAMKSLYMSGHTISGRPITVTGGSPPKSRAMSQVKSPDMRRNLYVLGLPFDLSKAELSSIFSQFGTVTHSVILATVDNASRRRGFVVMSNHAEAKTAMDNISQTNIRGSIVDVSWAVVQRSQGFLDGGDRTVTLEGQVDSAPPSADLSSTPAPAFQPSGLLCDHPKVSPLSGARSRHASIFVRNLPALLFAQDSDLEPLFCPFGDVIEIRRQGVSSAAWSHTDTISVVVTYSSVAGAREAKAVLEGQRYGDIPLIVECLSSFDCNAETGWKYGRDRVAGSSLNPCASPFVSDTPSAASAPPTCLVSGTFPDYFSKPSSSGSATLLNRFSLLEPVAQGYRSLPASGFPSRSNSAASWNISHARPSFHA
ncbi:hypothetical protein EDB92DRAFT_1874150 [Lactarius akahatsu]|uniref:RRM domain-containing protein n=1 Tax=Lactarius akahatsu TaxID=416441 RepID=A0AAD4LDN0_9AGAM|nr:hypothetical protein EDB92DRAFT_1874150 [Lactarius akahatsu]